MIQDVIEEIKKVNQMIDARKRNGLQFAGLNSTNDIDFMLKQYQSKRDQLISELEQELVKLNDFDYWKEWKNKSCTN
jgi:hypothetical protein